MDLLQRPDWEQTKQRRSAGRAHERQSRGVIGVNAPRNGASFWPPRRGLSCRWLTGWTILTGMRGMNAALGPWWRGDPSAKHHVAGMGCMAASPRTGGSTSYLTKACQWRVNGYSHHPKGDAV